MKEPRWPRKPKPHITFDPKSTRPCLDVDFDGEVLFAYGVAPDILAVNGSYHLREYPDEVYPILDWWKTIRISHAMYIATQGRITKSTRKEFLLWQAYEMSKM